MSASPLQFAIQYSRAAVDLLEAGDIKADLFKLPDWPDLIAEAAALRPVYVHFPHYVGRMDGSVNTPPVDWERVAHLREQTGTPFVNCHLAPHVDSFPGMTLDSAAAADLERVVAQGIADMQMLAGRFGVESVILENVPYDPSPKFSIPRPAYLPEAMQRVVAASGCGLLLDTAHARIAALYLDMDPLDYIAQMPGHALRELHVTGCAWNEATGRWEDHYAMTPEDWALVEAVFERIRDGGWAAPRIVALEYGGIGGLFEERCTRESLAENARRLYAMVQTLLANP